MTLPLPYDIMYLDQPYEIGGTLITLPDEANEEAHHSDQHCEDEYCQHRFLLDVLETNEFEEADAIIIAISRGNELIPFGWGDNLIHLRGLAEMTADFYRDSSKE